MWTGAHTLKFLYNIVLHRTTGQVLPWIIHVSHDENHKILFLNLFLPTNLQPSFISYFVLNAIERYFMRKSVFYCPVLVQYFVTKNILIEFLAAVEFLYFRALSHKVRRPATLMLGLPLLG